MLVRNSFALLMIGMTMVPLGSADDYEPAQNSPGQAEGSLDAGNETGETAPSSSAASDRQSSSTIFDLGALGTPPEDPEAVLCWLTERISGICVNGFDIVDVDYGPGYAGTGTCPGQTTCAAAPAIWFGTHKVENGHIVVCVNLSASC